MLSVLVCYGIQELKVCEVIEPKTTTQVAESLSLLPATWGDFHKSVSGSKPKLPLPTACVPNRVPLS